MAEGLPQNPLRTCKDSRQFKQCKHSSKDVFPSYNLLTDAI